MKEIFPARDLGWIFAYNCEDMVTVQTGLRIYCADRAKMIQECKNPIAQGDFNGFLHVTVQVSELLQDMGQLRKDRV